jgi:hypothetical protein
VGVDVGVETGVDVGVEAGVDVGVEIGVDEVVVVVVVVPLQLLNNKPVIIRTEKMIRRLFFIGPTPFNHSISNRVAFPHVMS